MDKMKLIKFSNNPIGTNLNEFLKQKKNDSLQELFLIVDRQIHLLNQWKKKGIYNLQCNSKSTHRHK